MTNEIVHNSITETTEEIANSNLKIDLIIFDSIYKNWTYDVANIDKNAIMSIKINNNLNNLKDSLEDKPS